MKPVHALAATAVAVIWGVNFLFIHGGLLDVPPLVLAAVRFVFVAVPAVFFVKRPRVPWWVLAGIGLFMSAGQFGAVYTAMSLGMPAGLSPLVLQSQMIFTVLIAVALFRERPGLLEWLGLAVGVAGLVVVGIGRGLSAPIGPMLLVLLGGLSWGVGNTFSRFGKGASGLGIVVWSALWVPLPLLALASLQIGPGAVGHALLHFTGRAWISTAYTVVLASLVGYSIWNGLLGRYPASKVVPFSLLAPPSGMLAAWIVLGERPNALELIGGAVLLAGVLTALRPRRRAAKNGGGAGAGLGAGIDGGPARDAERARTPEDAGPNGTDADQAPAGVPGSAIQRSGPNAS